MFLGIAAYFVFAQEKLSVVFFGKFMFFVAVITTPFMTWNLDRLSYGKGEWKIQTMQHEVVWKHPKNVGEKILNLPISKLSKIICESSKNTNACNYHYARIAAKADHAQDRKRRGLQPWNVYLTSELMP